MDNLTNNENKKQEEEDVVQKLSEMEEELNVHLQPKLIKLKNEIIYPEFAD